MIRKLKLALVLPVLFLMVLYIFQDIMIWRRVYPLAYSDLVWESSDKYEVDPYLVLSIIKVESKFEPSAVSRKGAKGLMQLMPETANWIASQGNIMLEEGDLYLPEINIPFGTWYLSHLIKQFEDEVIAIAAYNAGQGNVQRWIEEGIWDGTIDDAENIPFRETRAYVGRVKVAWWKYLDIYGK